MEEIIDNASQNAVNFSGAAFLLLVSPAHLKDARASEKTTLFSLCYKANTNSNDVISIKITRSAKLIEIKNFSNF